MTIQLSDACLRIKSDCESRSKPTEQLTSAVIRRLLSLKPGRACLVAWKTEHNEKKSSVMVEVRYKGRKQDFIRPKETMRIYRVSWDDKWCGFEERESAIKNALSFIEYIPSSMEEAFRVVTRSELQKLGM